MANGRALSAARKRKSRAIARSQASRSEGGKQIEEIPREGTPRKWRAVPGRGWTQCVRQESSLYMTVTLGTTNSPGRGSADLDRR